MKKIIRFILATVLALSALSMNAFAATKINFTNQDVTGYFDDFRIDGDKDGSGFDYAASGIDYEHGFVAVHGASYNQPIYPYEFGMYLYIDPDAPGQLGEPINTPLGPVSAFVVQDTGDFGGDNSTFWFDVYCGRWTDYGNRFNSDKALANWINQNIPKQQRNYYVYK